LVLWFEIANLNNALRTDHAIIYGIKLNTPNSLAKLSPKERQYLSPLINIVVNIKNSLLLSNLAQFGFLFDYFQGNKKYKVG
jgi:hypothetical protein